MSVNIATLFVRYTLSPRDAADPQVREGNGRLGKDGQQVDDLYGGPAVGLIPVVILEVDPTSTEGPLRKMSFTPLTNG